jgi:post-segregation antitoxin (ccd killing protein)
LKEAKMVREKKYSWYEYFAKHGKGSTDQQAADCAREAGIASKRAERYEAEAAKAPDKKTKCWYEERARRAHDRAEYLDAKGTYGDSN